MSESEDFPQRYAEALAALEPSAGGALSDQEIGALLRFAREVAHRSERRWAPVASYLAGRFVAARIRAGVDLDQAVGEAMSVAGSLLPPPADETPA